MDAVSPRRIAFLDVDGTILDHRGTVAVSTVDAIRSARAAGHLVLLSTGRSSADVPPVVRAIGFDGVVSNGGAYATVGDETVVARPMPVAAVHKLTDYFEAAGIRYLLQTDDGAYADAEVQAIFDDLHRRLFASHEPDSAPRLHDIATLDRADVAKAVFLSDDADAVTRAQSDLGDAFHVVPGSMPLPGGSNGEIGMLGTTKGSAILDVLAHLGLTKDAAIGVGDSWNDVEMFEVCGVGIAMGNADAALQALADEVTTSVTEDGVWNAFVRHGLVDR
ncbi:HAD family hydrolase [Microbacterium sp. NPDC019599]|uniref:HAD family hydrolase n=1 Tax=Microbacterium sp. NPDC019599 TaxID=3154690 RepID=UPI00340C3483